MTFLGLSMMRIGGAHVRRRLKWHKALLGPDAAVHDDHDFFPRELEHTSSVMEPVPPCCPMLSRFSKGNR
jgi:hypothetical protein